MTIDFWLPHVKTAGGTKVTLRYAQELQRCGNAVRVFVPFISWRDRFARRGTWKDHFTVPIHYVKRWEEAAKHARGVIVADSWQVARELITHAPARARLFEIVQHDERLFHGEAAEVEEVYRSAKLQKIVVATWLKDLFRDEFGIHTDLVGNTVDRGEFFPVPELRARNGIVRVLMLVHTYPWKGTEEGISIAASLRERHPNIRLVGFGVRTAEPPAGLDEYHFDPSSKQLRELYASANIFLCPSWVEGFGLPSLEAMACGATLVTYENGGSRDYATDGVTALVAARRDQVALAAKLEVAVVDAELRAKLSENALAFVRNLPTPAEQATRLETILTS